MIRPRVMALAMAFVFAAPVLSAFSPSPGRAVYLTHAVPKGGESVHYKTSDDWGPMFNGTRVLASPKASPGPDASSLGRAAQAYWL